MSVEPTDPEDFEDTYEAEPDEEPADPEAPPEDAAEQHAELLRQREMPITGREDIEADPADAAEQARVVEVNEDEYR
ncbi:hypothetical protein DB35_14350 [Streptomyces abyssalis]|uniref:Uncharacterized protein n=1 Tax=Streptomyces abyssalis TaxID=933944 RepID=A0A1E7JGB3_9ACTN|nr:hypothetical protein [Streptomyces abyssalis]OEU85511.1 hypothetical protein AN215_23660 [Streptomyces abyssalis]OEU93026.1 hypothetical protein DB35_14350 [Streptomyces abyssalis]OEV27801.1 hypothetical protein AN219_21930 [Streptomyces nanshensis]